MEALFNIVLYTPEIPQNCGNIGRLAVSTGSRLHLIKPLGFELSDKYIRRSGMDYWRHLDLAVYDNWEEFQERNPDAELYFFTTKTSRSFWDCPYARGSFLIFGSEGHGLPEQFYRTYRQRLYTIPMPGKFHRSLNLANSAAIVLYEGLRRYIPAGSGNHL